MVWFVAFPIYFDYITWTIHECHMIPMFYPNISHGSADRNIWTPRPPSRSSVKDRAFRSILNNKKRGHGDTPPIFLWFFFMWVKQCQKPSPELNQHKSITINIYIYRWYGYPSLKWMVYDWFSHIISWNIHRSIHGCKCANGQSIDIQFMGRELRSPSILVFIAEVTVFLDECILY